MSNIRVAIANSPSIPKFQKFTIYRNRAEGLGRRPQRALDQIISVVEWLESLG